jgi:hypothetical protein
MILTETSMSELSDMELDAVCGGFLNFRDSFNSVVQTNTGVQLNLGGLGVAQILGQFNTSII